MWILQNVKREPPNHAFTPNNKPHLKFIKLQNYNNFTFNLENCRNFTLNLESYYKQRPHPKPKNDTNMMTKAFESKPNRGMCTLVMRMQKTSYNKAKYPKSMFTCHLQIWAEKPTQCQQQKPRNLKTQWCVTRYLKMANAKNKWDKPETQKHKLEKVLFARHDICSRPPRETHNHTNKAHKGAWQFETKITKCSSHKHKTQCR